MKVQRKYSNGIEGVFQGYKCQSESAIPDAAFFRYQLYYIGLVTAPSAEELTLSANLASTPFV